MPPSTTDGSSDDERDDGNNTENECCRLPMVCSLLLFSGQLLFRVQTLLFLGELLLDGNSSLPFLSGVAEQGMGMASRGEKHRGHEYDAGKSFHIDVPFLEMGTKNPAPFENRTFVGLMFQARSESLRLKLCTCYILYHT